MNKAPRIGPADLRPRFSRLVVEEPLSPFAAIDGCSDLGIKERYLNQ